MIDQKTGEIRPAPLTPADCDLTDYPSLLVDVHRVRNSRMAANETPEACWAGFLLWCAAWHQVPAGSIPNEETWIAKQAGYATRGRIDEEWAGVRAGALRGFVMCSDGRLYHDVVCEKALECWIDKQGRVLSSGAGNHKRWGVPFDPKPIEAQLKRAKTLLRALNPNSKALTKRRHVAVPTEAGPDPAGNPAGTTTGQTGDAGQGSSTEAEASKRALWRQAKAWLKANGVTAGDASAFVNTLAQQYPGVIEQALTAAMGTPQPGDAKSWLSGIAKQLAEERTRHPVPKTVASTAAEQTQAELAQRGAHEPTLPTGAAADRLAEQRSALAAKAGMPFAPTPRAAPAPQTAPTS